MILKTIKILEQGIFLFILFLVFSYDAFAEAIGFLDEAGGLFSLVFILIFILIKGKIKLYRNEYYIMLLLFFIAIIGLLSNYSAHTNGYITSSKAIINDFIIFFKAFWVYLAIRLFSKNINSERLINKLAKYSKVIFYILIIFIVADLIFYIYPRELRYGVFSIELFFQHPSRYGFAFAFIFLVLLPQNYANNKKLLFAILFCGLLCLRVKYLGFLFLTIFFILYGKRLFEIPKMYFFLTITALTSVITWFFWDWLIMYFTFESLNEAWSRAVVLYYSFIIGNDFFPFGTGFGTYCSYYSGLEYSWVYGLYGIDKVYGLSRTYGVFITDQYWPMVLGQFGYLGLISFALMIYQYFLLFIGQIKSNRNNIKYYYFLSAILGLLMLLIDSTSDSIFTQQRAVVLFAYFALIVNLTEKKLEP